MCQPILSICVIFGVTGGSAGSHLPALLGTSNGEPSLEGLHLGSPNVTSDVHAVADFHGPSDFLQMDDYIPSSCTNPQVHNVIGSPESKLRGCLISSYPSRVTEGNSITYINGNEPPFSIHHGAAVCTVPSHQSQLLHDALIFHGQNSGLTIYHGAGHGNYMNSAVRDSMVSFFNKELVNNCN